MRNSVLRAVWPRAESHLYSESKLLEKRGLAVSHQEYNGGRKRTVYNITESGREALKHWLREERESEFRFEYELLVRLAFAESVTVDVALAYLRQVREEIFRDAAEALLAVEAELEQPRRLATRPHAAFSGALIHLVVSELESRLRWSDEMTRRLDPLQEGEESRGQVAADLYREARASLMTLLEDA
jgi:DNA-binding PadR family transcriptional regulator